jgi:hypothetical protein
MILSPKLTLQLGMAKKSEKRQLHHIHKTGLKVRHFLSSPFFLQCSTLQLPIFFPKSVQKSGFKSGTGERALI